MKIGPSNTDGIRNDGKTVGPDRSPTVRPGAGSDPVSGPAAVDRVSLSGGSAALAGSNGPMPFDDKKVEEVRRAIAEGRFPVDAKRVAEELLADARDLLGLGPNARTPPTPGATPR